MSRTRIQTRLDEAISVLTELRSSYIAGKALISEKSPRDLRDLSELLGNLAVAVDPLIRTVAFEAGQAKDHGPSIYDNTLADRLHDDLQAELESMADDLASSDDRPSYNPQRDLGTLSREIQGVN